MRITLKTRILHLARKGPVTIDQVLGALGRYVTASQAMRAYEVYRRYGNKRFGTRRNYAIKKSPVEVGKRIVLKNKLKAMADRGKLKRVGRGIYGIPKTKLKLVG